MRAFVRQHPAVSYFGLAFLLSWGGILVVIRGGAIPAPPDEAQRLFVFVYLAMLVGPSVAGIAVTALAGGRRGIAEFHDRLTKWRVGARWYAVALLTAPLSLLAALVFLTPSGSDYIPNVLDSTANATPVQAGSRSAFLLMSVLVGIGAGFFEELGWTGLALPKLRARHGFVTAGLLLGVMWGAWHFLAILWGSAGAFGSVPVAIYLMVALFSFLPPYRILMAWVYDRTQSILVAVLMHMSLTASMLILGPAVAGNELLTFDLVFGAVLWAVAGILMFGTSARRLEALQPLAR